VLNYHFKIGSCSGSLRAVSVDDRRQQSSRTQKNHLILSKNSYGDPLVQHAFLPAASVTIRVRLKLFRREIFHIVIDSRNLERRRLV